MDTIKGLALIATFIGFLTIFAIWVSLWDNVWQAFNHNCHTQPVPTLVFLNDRQV